MRWRLTSRKGAGATPYQVVPPSQIDCTAPDNQAWAREILPDGPELHDLSELGDDRVLGLWLDLYVWVHEAWSPVHSLERAREIFAPMLAESLDPELSQLAVRDGEPTATASALREGEELLIVCEAVARDTPTGMVVPQVGGSGLHLMQFTGTVQGLA